MPLGSGSQACNAGWPSLVLSKRDCSVCFCWLVWIDQHAHAHTHTHTHTHAHTYIHRDTDTQTYEHTHTHTHTYTETQIRKLTSTHTHAHTHTRARRCSVKVNVKKQSQVFGTNTLFERRNLLLAKWSNVNRGISHLFVVCWSGVGVKRRVPCLSSIK